MVSEKRDSAIEPIEAVQRELMHSHLRHVGRDDRWHTGKSAEPADVGARSEERLRLHRRTAAGVAAGGPDAGTLGMSTPREIFERADPAGLRRYDKTMQT